FAVLLIDEAQNLSASLLEEVRILSDLEGTRKLLQVVLIGQPELSSALRLPHMRQVKQRVTTHCELQPLDRDGVYGYVAHRLMVAGASADRLHFTAYAIARSSVGMRRVPWPSRPTWFDRRWRICSSCCPRPLTFCPRSWSRRS